ncbi:MAG: PQQ-binding-like beta-propeller repeat protein [Planctomycetota bacterium]
MMKSIAWRCRPTGVMVGGLALVLSMTAPNRAIAAKPDAESTPVAVWGVPRSDAGASGYVRHSLPTDMSLIWESETDEAIETTPAIDPTAVYVADVMGGVEALDRSSGKRLWRRELDTGFVASPSLLSPDVVLAQGTAFPILSGDDAMTDQVVASAREKLPQRITPRLLLGDVEGNVWSLDPQSGTTQWQQTVDGEISSAVSFFAIVSPASSKDDPAKVALRVLVTSQDGKLRCLDADDGTMIWEYATNDQIRCGASIGSGKTFLGGCDGSLHIIDLVTGQSVGEPLPLGGPTGSTPAIDGDDVFVPIMDGLAYRFSIQTGEAVWMFEDDSPQDFRGDAAIADDRIILASRSKQVFALSRQTGEVIWESTLKRRPDASPLIVGEDVWVASSDGRLARLALSDGRETWSYEIRGSFIASPAILGDRLIIADDDGVVRCFGPQESPQG